MTKVNEQLRCTYCEAFFPYDIAKDWLDYIHNKSDIIKKEKDNGISTVCTELPKIRGSK